MINFERDDIKKFIDKQVDQDFVPMVLNLQKLVQIKSVESVPLQNMPFGEGPCKALALTLKICSDLGFKTTNLDNYVGYAEIGHGEEIIGVMTHLDVVPEGEGWDYPPYGGTIINGKMIGRGVSDNKSPAMASIYALNLLKNMYERENLDINKRIRLIFGTNEETGFQCIEHYLKSEKPVDIGFTPDGMFPVIHGEKGIMQVQMKVPFNGKVTFQGISEEPSIQLISIKGGVATNSVPDRTTAIFEGPEDSIYKLKHLIGQTIDSKANFEYEIAHLKDSNKKRLLLNSFGKAAHASINDEGINSISYLVDKLIKVGICNDFLNIYNEIIGLELNGKSLNIDFTDAYGDLTLNTGIIDVVDDVVDLSIDIRYPITKTLEEVVDAMSVVCDKYDIQLTVEIEKGPLYYNPDEPFIQTLLKAYKDVTDDERLPITIGGGTYARSMKNVVAFGATFPMDTPNAHEANEFIILDRLKTQIKIYLRAIDGLLKM